VHHAILFVDTTGQAEKLDEADPGPGYTCFGGPGIDLASGGVAALLDLNSALGGWAPGNRTQRLPENVGILLSHRARIVLQMHYNTRAREGEDRTRIGLYFNRERAPQRMFYVPVVNTSFRIPPGEAAYEVRAALPVLPFFDAKLIQIVPHMHLLGRDIKVEVQRGSDSESLIWIDNWDFHWQNFYTYQDPVPLQTGSTVRLSCRFDNSSANPRNPHDPPEEVRWGEGTEDEMCIAFLGVTFDNFRALPFAIAPQGHGNGRGAR
jgi:hypothetical protein